MERVRKNLYRIMSILLSVAMISGSFGGMTLSVEAEGGIALEEEKTISVDMELPETDELFEGYAEQLFYDYEETQMFSVGNQSAGAQLTGDEKLAYDALIPIIKRIAAGERSSSVIALGESFEYNDEFYDVDKSVVFTENKNEFNAEVLLSALLADCPYELYWFDKVTGYSISLWSNGETLYQVIFSFYVADNYQSTDEFTVNGGYVTEVKNAVERANSIVNKHASKNDYEKLAAYRQEICELVTYDHNAAEIGDFSLDNDPWQLVHVFDGMTSTNVVCEGYSKAFQYLCDQSSFLENDTACYSVTGTMSSGTGAGPHMWNVVTMENNQYLVDVTNCDDGSIGFPDKLFMVGADSGSVGSGYVVSVSNNNIIYAYDADQKAVWGTEILTLANSDYTAGSGGAVVEKAIAQVVFEDSTVAVEYTGEEIVLPVVPVVTVNGVVIDSPELTFSYRPSGSDEYIAGLPTEVGSYEVLATLAEGDDYKGAISNVLILIVEEPKIAAPGVALNTDANGNVTGVKITNHAASDDTTIYYGYFIDGSPALLMCETFASEETKTLPFLEMLIPSRELVGETFTFECYVGNADWDTTELSERVMLDYDITMEEKEYSGGEILVEVEIDEENQEIYWIEEDILPEQLRSMYLTNSVENVTAGADETYYFAPPWPVEGRTCWGASYTDAKISFEKLTLGEVRPSEEGMKFVWSDVPKSKITVERKKETPTIIFNDYNPTKIYDGLPLALPNASQINISHGLTEVRYEWHKESAEGDVVTNPVGVGKYVLVAYLEETETTKAVRVTSDVFEIRSVLDTGFGGGQDTTYRIFYELNGGQHNPKNPIEYIEGLADIVLQAPTRSGYEFLGWYSDPDFGFPDNVIESGSTGNKEFYAKWARKYNIRYELNGGTNHASNPNSYNTESEFLLEDPTKEGYRFDGWYSESTFKNKVAGIEYGTSETKVFYAKWTKIKYTISYSLNGGKNNISNPTSYYITSETISLKNPTKKGYNFQGWYTDSSYTNKVTQITKGSTGNQTLYAKWSAISYKITYKLNYGTNHVSNPKSYTIATTTITLKNPTRKGYTFQGWYSDSGFKTKVGKIAKGSTGNKTLYAKWAKTKYAVTYTLNGGKNNSSNPSSYYVTTPTITLKTPTKKGYTFQGWYLDSGFQTKITKIANGSTGNKKLYAKWAKTKYTITYVLNGGKNNASNPASYYITSTTIILKNPTKTGYTFKGWYSDSNFKNKVAKIYNGSTGNRKLYAKWSVNSYTIKFNRNGGDSGSMSALTGRKYGKSYTLPANTYKRTGWTFAGWNTKKDGSGKYYKNKASVKNLTAKNGGTVTLYAQWKPYVNLIVVNDLPAYIYNLSWEGDIITAIAITDVWYEWKWYNYDPYSYDVTIDVAAYKVYDEDGDFGENYVGTEYVIKNSSGYVIESGTISKGNLCVGDGYVDKICLYDIPRGDYYIEFRDYD